MSNSKSSRWQRRTEYCLSQIVLVYSMLETSYSPDINHLNGSCALAGVRPIALVYSPISTQTVHQVTTAAMFISVPTNGCSSVATMDNYAYGSTCRHMHGAFTSEINTYNTASTGLLDKKVTMAAMSPLNINKSTFSPMW